MTAVEPRGVGTADPAAPPAISVIVPVRDGGEELARCLGALTRSSFRDYELLVVDDASRDRSAELAAAHGARVLSLAARRGPAAARNAGAHAARGQVLFFLDADCEVHPDALAIASAVFAAEPRVDALFGSYDDRPADPGRVSQWKNLFHHWTHQRAAEHAVTFWAGCGAVRRELFLAVGGFDEARYPLPSVEDIELGYRLSDGGAVIRLVKSLQVRHLKRWTLRNLVHTDVARRGVPWTELLVERRGRGATLNLGVRERWTVLAGAAAALALPAALLHPAALAVAFAAAAGVVALTSDFYRLLRRRHGLGFAVAAVPLHLLYCLYSAVAFALGLGRAALTPARGADRAAPAP